MAKESSVSTQDKNKTVLSSHKAEFLPQLWSPSKTQNHLAKVGTNESPETTSVTRGHSPYLQVCILQPLVASGVALIDMVCLGSGFPYADAYYVICLGYLHSLWGPFWFCAKLGLKIMYRYLNLYIHTFSLCATHQEVYLCLISSHISHWHLF